MRKEIIFGLLISALAVGGFASEEDGIFSFKVGQFEVFMLVESERDGNTNIIPGADAATLNRYIPASGFRHTANAFLVKAPGQNILIDAGTGAGGVILNKVRSLGVQPEQISSVLITHLHMDHFGGLRSDGRANFPNAKIYLDSKELEHFTKTAPNQAAVDTLALYGSNVITFDALPLGLAFKEVLPGIRAIANHGHTPGHTVFMLESGSARLIIAGDFLHVGLVQFPNPDISATFDMDQGAAAASRRQILDYAVRNNVPIGGMHVVYPGIGRVQAEGNGFTFVPIN
jgi:glyoxylase-like metal-dependent hydrolase (beta-lactamase superfamily II)